MKLAALGSHAPMSNVAGAQGFLTRASLRRGFNFTEREMDRLSPRQVRWYTAYLQGLDDAAAERQRNQRR